MQMHSRATKRYSVALCQKLVTGIAETGHAWFVCLMFLWGVTFYLTYWIIDLYLSLEGWKYIENSCLYEVLWMALYVGCDCTCAACYVSQYWSLQPSMNCCCTRVISTDLHLRIFTLFWSAFRPWSDVYSSMCASAVVHHINLLCMFQLHHVSTSM